jgi:succinate dehydrogenase/fumarate reductase flavoprotein subunit
VPAEKGGSMSSSQNPSLAVNSVIIGGGGAGMMAAIAAAKAGLKNILVLEKASTPGGNTSISHGIFAVNSPAQKRLGIQISADDVFKDKMAYANWRTDARLVRTIIDQSADLIQWLDDWERNSINKIGEWKNEEKKFGVVFISYR